MEKIKSILHVGHHSKDTESTNTSSTNTGSSEITDPDYKKLHGTYNNTSLDENGRGVIPGKQYDEETDHNIDTANLDSSSRGRQHDSSTFDNDPVSATGTSSGLAGESNGSSRGADYVDPAYTSTSTTTSTNGALYGGIQGEILPGPANVHGAVVSEGTSDYTPALQHLREHGMGETDAAQYDPHLSGYTHGTKNHSLVQENVPVEQTIPVQEQRYETSGPESSRAAETTAGTDGVSDLKSTGYSGEANTETSGTKPGLSQAWAESQGNM